MEVELAPVIAMLDESHPDLPTARDLNAYKLGRIQGHNTVIAVLPEIGQNTAATVAIQLLNDFPPIRFGLLVGIGGGVPGQDGEDDVRLGDVVVSRPTDTFGGVVQYDMGKITADGAFQRTGALNKPPKILSAAVGLLRAKHRFEGSKVPEILSQMWEKFPRSKQEYGHPGPASDQLFEVDYSHPSGSTCRNCDKAKLVTREKRLRAEPVIHYGTIGSANLVVKDAITCERLKKDFGLICVEMEAAGLMDSFPCLVIRGICDYADSHKNKRWQPYAAVVAAAYMKELLFLIPTTRLAEVAPASELLQERGMSSSASIACLNHSKKLMTMLDQEADEQSLSEYRARNIQMGSSFNSKNLTTSGRLNQIGNISMGRGELIYRIVAGGGTPRSHGSLS